MCLWLIPMIYVAASAVCGLTLPRIEQAYLGSYSLNLSVASAQAYLSAAASGTMALTGIVFAMAFINGTSGRQWSARFADNIATAAGLTTCRRGQLDHRERGEHLRNGKFPE